jgi:alkylation response protein AidB-like acyl-CoA dehydrogenase
MAPSATHAAAAATRLAAPGPDFSLGEDQELLRQQVRRFAEERIRPGVQERDRAHRFPAEVVAEMGELGLLGMMVEERYGGAGADVLGYLVAVEELARVCPASAVTMSVSNSVCCWPIAQFGSDDLKRRTLPELAGGALGAFALTEPGAGSDPSALRATARREGTGGGDRDGVGGARGGDGGERSHGSGERNDGGDRGGGGGGGDKGGGDWLLSGEKAWITNAGLARWYVVFARTDPAAGKRGITAFVVPHDAPGLTVGLPEEKLGLRASQTAALHFSDCRVPAANVLGAVGQGFKIALATLDHSRLGIAAQAVGIHQRALELAVAYARERVQFGVPIARHQAVQFRIAQIATELAAARVLTHRAALAAHAYAGALEGGGTGAGDTASAGRGIGERRPGRRRQEAGRLAAQAKLFASEAANRACQESLQIHGGNGFHEDYEIARLYRDVRVTTIYEGTSEMQRLVIARHLLQTLHG